MPEILALNLDGENSRSVGLKVKIEVHKGLYCHAILASNHGQIASNLKDDVKKKGDN